MGLNPLLRGRAAGAVLATEREFVLTLGGLSIAFAGGILVLHERIPAPRFNYVDISGVSPSRQAGFFERVLDQYFQRAIRPVFRVELPVPAHVDRTLRRLGFRPRREPLDVLVAARASRLTPGSARVRPAPELSGSDLALLWVTEREAPELASALDIVVHHPNPAEHLVPVIAESEGTLLGAALLYRHARTAILWGVATQPSARGRGVASTLTDRARRLGVAGRGVRFGILSEQRRLTARLRRLGFVPVRSMRLYELPADAELEVPKPGPPGPPRWRPPRSADGSRRAA